MALHKKKSPSDPDNYREVHLTSQISKAVERLLGQLFAPFLLKTVAYGPRQFAYSQGRGARDALLYATLKWLRTLGKGRRLALFCSDVSGAFDRVPTSTLVSKLALKGLHPLLVAVIRDWLSARSARVLVGGESSDLFTILDSVYQGTVWGPILWNCFFDDSRQMI